MKKLLTFSVLISLIAASSFVIWVKRENYYAFYNALDPCKKPIEFRVDNVDKRFNLPKEKVVEYAKEAADIWNRAYGKQLFVYSENGELSVNMVFDSRQQASNKIGTLDKNVETEKGKLDTLIQQHETNVNNFKNRLAEHNRKVQLLNSSGGATPDEYEKLVEEQKSLEAEASELNQKAKNLNIATEDYNLQVGQLNEAINDFNKDLAKKPEEGLYIGEENKIEIYFNNYKDELLHTMAHEFGHARGIDHNNNPKSIMYPFTSQIKSLSSDDIESLTAVCSQKSPVEVLKSRIRYSN